MVDTNSENAGLTERSPRFDDRRIGKDQAKVAWRAAGSGEGRYGVADVKAVTAGEMVAVLRERLVVGQTVWIHDLPTDRVATVLCCVKQWMRYLVVLKIRSQERRREFRSPAVGYGTLQWSGAGGVKRVTVLVRNMTDNGMQLEVAERMEVTQSIRLSGETWECQGVIRYCRPQDGRLVTGVQLTRPPYLKDCLEQQD